MGEPEKRKFERLMLVSFAAFLKRRKFLSRVKACSRIGRGTINHKDTADTEETYRNYREQI
jgi:hypothetical protein